MRKLIDELEGDSSHSEEDEEEYRPPRKRDEKALNKGAAQNPISFSGMPNSLAVGNPYSSV
jgi:hypothetical protein